MASISIGGTDYRDKNSSISLDIEVDAMFSAGALFTARGFSHATIKALVVGGIDAPERLLFADEIDLLSISGLDEQALDEIARYRGKFAEGMPTQTDPRELIAHAHEVLAMLTGR
jgi:hypothetical protein